MEQALVLGLQSLTGMLSCGQSCMLGTAVPCSVYALKSQVSLWACSLTLPCLPLMCHVVSGVLDAVFSSQLGRGPPTSLPRHLGASQSQNYTPCPRTPFSSTGKEYACECMQRELGPCLCAPFPSALLLPSDCDHCPCCLLSRPPPFTPSPKVLVQPAAHFVRFLCRINICICSEPLLGMSFPPAV